MFVTVLPVLGLLFCVLSQITIYRLQRRLMKSFICGTLIAIVALAGSSIHFGLSAGHLFSLEVTCLVLCYGYFHFLNLGETARRIRYLRELARAPSHCLSEQELVQKYASQEMVERRIGRLLRSHQIQKVDDRLILNDHTLLAITQIMAAINLLIFGRDFGGLVGKPPEPYRPLIRGLADLEK